MAKDTLMQKYEQFSPRELSFLCAMQEQYNDCKHIEDLAEQTLIDLKDFLNLAGGSVLISPREEELIEIGRIKETPEILEGIDEITQKAYKEQRTIHENTYLAIPLDGTGVFFVYNVKGFKAPQIRFIKEVISALYRAIKANEKSDRDSLTKLCRNRETLEKSLEAHINYAQSYGEPFSYTMIDLDNFKNLNDTLGHLAGDYVLTEVSKILKETIGERLVFQYGGEEFVILQPKKDEKEAYNEAEELRQKIEDHYFEYDGTPISVTISGGTAQYRSTETKDQFKIRTDKALYGSKENGKNQIRLSVINSVSINKNEKGERDLLVKDYSLKELEKAQY